MAGSLSLRSPQRGRRAVQVGALLLLVGTGCTGQMGYEGETEPPGVGGTPSTGGTTTGGGTTRPPTGTPGLPGSPMGGSGTPTTPSPGASAPLNAGGMPLRRLTPREYNNTVRDLLGDTSRPADQFPATKSEGFTFSLPGPVATQDALLLRSAAETLAANASKKLSTLVPCDPAKGDDACARRFIETFGLRAYRRPLVAADTNKLMGLYTTGRTTLGMNFADAVTLVIEGMLQAPEFLYHWAQTPGPVKREGTLVKLGGYQVASRLSYFLWGTMPDQALFDAAAAGKLDTPAGIEMEARRLLADPKARETVSSFFEDWLDMESLVDQPKDPKHYPEYNDALRTAMVHELSSFAQSAVFDGDGKWSTLLLSPAGFGNQALATLYGMNQVKGTEMRKLDLEPAQRPGFLTRAAFLALTGAAEGSNPSRRGLMVLEKLLCQVMPPPPPDVPDVKPAMPGMTTRQRFSEHANLACARGCHGLIDPYGFAFEHYDGIGKYRTTDEGLPVDSSGSVTLDGKTHPFENALGLNKVLAGSADVQRCFSTQWLRFGLLRPETDADRGSIEAGLKAVSAGTGNVRDLLLALATSPSFRYRSPAMGEVLP